VKGFKKCCISNAMDGTKGNLLWNDSEEYGDVRTERKEVESTDYENGGSDIDW
jgi:hypothetical protein